MLEKKLEEVLDERQLDGLSAGDLFMMMRLVTEQIRKFDEELPEDAAEPFIRKLMDFSDAIMRRLDPQVRKTLGDEPAALAQWDEIMRDFDADMDEREETLPADIESSQIS